MIVKHKLRTWERAHKYYAVGDHALIKRAAEGAFASLRWHAKWDDGGALVHYPGGWPDRAYAGYWRSVNINPMAYIGPDLITISLPHTNNSTVTLLRTSLYLKRTWFNKEKQEKRIEDFYAAVQYEFRKLELPLVQHELWADLVGTHPVLCCSPVWSPEHWQPVPASQTPNHTSEVVRKVSG